MYSRTGLRSISLKGGPERQGEHSAGLIREGAPRLAMLTEMGRGSHDGNAEIQRKTRVERS